MAKPDLFFLVSSGREQLEPSYPPPSHFCPTLKPGVTLIIPSVSPWRGKSLQRARIWSVFPGMADPAALGMEIGEGPSPAKAFVQDTLA